jgi:hypothetical protein
MSMKRGVILTGKLKNSKKDLSQCHFVHHKSHIYWAQTCSERPVTNRLSHGGLVFLKHVAQHDEPLNWGQ